MERVMKILLCAGMCVILAGCRKDIPIMDESVTVYTFAGSEKNETNMQSGNDTFSVETTGEYKSTAATETVTEGTQPVTEVATEATQPVTETVTEGIQPATETLTEAVPPVTEPATQVIPSVSEVPTMSEFDLRVVNDIWVYSEYIQRVIGLVNISRRENGLPMLQYDINLSKVATHRCIENIDNNMFSHTRPDGSSCFTLYPTYGISFENAGENIAAGQTSPEEVMESWMNSPAHRGNILGDFEYIGVGISADASGCLYWTQCFRK